jgi:hypothetical protein
VEQLQLTPEKNFEIAINVAKVVGLFISGLWVAWTFHKLQKVRAADLENNERSSRLRASRLEQQAGRTKLLAQQPQLSVGLSITEEPSPSSDYESILCVAITLSNEGEQNLEAMFDSSALTVAAISFSEDGAPLMQVVLRTCPFYFTDQSDEPQEMPPRIFRSGQSRKVAAAVLPVPEPSAYFFQFQTTYFKVPFDGDKSPTKDSIYINALEQVFYVASGRKNFAGPDLAEAAT